MATPDLQTNKARFPRRDLEPPDEDGCHSVEDGNRFNRFLSSNLVAQNPYLVRGEGVWVWDHTGKKSLDFSSQTMNLSLGHCHPVVVKAICEQASNLMFASSRFHSAPFLKIAKKLVEIAPPELVCINHKLCNGSDSIETAVKIARKFTGKPDILVPTMGWHGESSETLRLCDRLVSKSYLGGSNAVQFASFPDLPRRIRDRSANLAAVLVEPVQVQAGVYCYPEVLQECRELCTKYRIPLIFDEIQTFGGWLDGEFFAANYFGVRPNMICLGKALGAGLALAAVLMEERFREVLEYNEAEYTHGGQALACSAALAAIETTKATDFRVQAKGEYLESCLSKLRTSFPFLGTRRWGLIAAVQFPDTRTCPEVYRICLQNGVIFRLSSNQQNLLLKPPIVIDEDEIELAMDGLTYAIGKAT